MMVETEYKSREQVRVELGVLVQSGASSEFELSSLDDHMSTLLADTDSLSLE